MHLTVDGLTAHLPPELRELRDPQTDLPRIAKDRRLTALIESLLREVATSHELRLGDARSVELEPESIQLVVTSPPYWTLKEYRDTDGQLGHVSRLRRIPGRAGQSVENVFPGAGTGWSACRRCG